MNIQDVFNSAQVLINVAIKAQEKGGVLTIKEAATVSQAIDIQEEYYKQLNEQIKSQEETGSQTDGEVNPKATVKGKVAPKVVK